MHNKVKIHSDKMKQAKKMFEGPDLGNEPELVPSDLYGRRTFPNKADPDNMKNAAEDIKESFGLND